MRPYPERHDRDWNLENPCRPCVLCGSELGLPQEVVGDETLVHRELHACRRCVATDYDALVMLVDDLHTADTRSPKRRGRTECPTCLSPACDCDRVSVLGGYWDHERKERA